MGRFTLLLGIVLMIASVYIMVLGLQATDNARVKNLLESLYCEESEQAVHEWSDYSFDSVNNSQGRSVRVYCEDITGEGTRREITAQAIGLLIGGFITLFIIGLLLFIFSIIAMVHRTTQSVVENFDVLSQLSQSGASHDVLRGHNTRQANIPPEALDTIQQVFSKIGTAVQSTIPKQDLAQRLEQLKEAYDKGLISANEYDRVREAILDKFDD